jgi:hypothetical protein
MNVNTKIKTRYEEVEWTIMTQGRVFATLVMNTRTHARTHTVGNVTS